MKNIGALRRGLLARIHGDERGFTLIEVMVAITIMFALLLALAYTATLGFTYESLGRQKQTATGIADQIMEQARGLAWDKIVAGHRSSDLSGDANLVTGCAGDAAGVYRFKSCTAGSTPGSGEKVVASAAACPVGTPDCVSPLVRHQGTITQNSIPFNWRTYDTNNCPPPSGCSGIANPYRVTVMVTWTGGRAAPNKIVQVQSLFWSPSGCRSTATHPFAAPCQPFFFGTATVPKGEINITGSVVGTSFQSGDLFASGVQSSVQQEQLSQAQGSFTQSGVSLVDDSGTHTAGGTVVDTSAADTDPGTTSGTWSTAGCPTTVTCSGGLIIASSSVVGNDVRLNAPSGETALSDSTSAAGGGNICPPPTDTAQTDGKPCGGSRIQQGGTLSATLRLNGTTPVLGNATLAQILQAASLPNKTFADRIQYNQTPAGLVCAPVVNSDGCIEEQATRNLGTVSVGGLPSGLTAPAGWSSSNGYFSISSYQDSAKAAAGTNVVPPTTTPQVLAPTVTGPTGTVSCWNGSNGYNTVTNPATALTCGTLTLTQTLSGHNIQVLISATSVSPASITRSPTAPSATITSVTAQVTPPSATLDYKIFIDDFTTPVVDLTITVNLGVLDVEGSYAVAPAKGS